MDRGNPPTQTARFRLCSDHCRSTLGCGPRPHHDCRKAIVAGWTRIPSWKIEKNLRDFARALARKRSHFAFPDDFVIQSRNFQEYLIDKHNKQSEDGAHLRALREIRVCATPSWDDEDVRLSWWFIRDDDPVELQANWTTVIERWLALFDDAGRFRLDSPIACRLEDMTARDYIESDHLDLDRLSVSQLK